MSYSNELKRLRCGCILIEDLEYVNGNSGALKNMQFLHLEMCFPYLELKVSHKFKVFVNLFPATRNY